MSEIEKRQNELQDKAMLIVSNSKLMDLLRILGNPIPCGSSVTGLMVYPDIDFSVQTESPDIQKAIDLVPVIFKDLGAEMVKIADFRDDSNETSAYYVGIRFRYLGELWQIDATIGLPGQVMSNPPEIDAWIRGMTSEEKLTILKLKRELIDSKRYVGSRSQPPYTFRSIHLYEGVIKGGAKSIDELESYFRHSR